MEFFVGDAPQQTFLLRRSPVLLRLVCLHRAAEEGSQLVGGTGAGRGGLLWAEHGAVGGAERGLEELLGADQQLLGELGREVGFLARCLGQVPTVAERVGCRDPDERGAGHLAERKRQNLVHDAVDTKRGEAALRALVER